MGWFNHQLVEIFFQFECIGFVIWDLTDGILQLWIDLRLEMGLSKTTISRLHFLVHVLLILGTTRYSFLCVCVVFDFYRCMNQAVYFCTGELQPALYAHYGLAMERRSAEWCDGPTQRSWCLLKRTPVVVAVVTIWEPLFFLCLNFILMNIGRWS